MTRPAVSRLAVHALGVALALVVSPTPSAQSPAYQLPTGATYVRDASGEMIDQAIELVEGPGDGVLPAPAGIPRDLRPRPLAVHPPYTFYPHAGTPGLDLFIANYVDLSGGASTFDTSLPGLDYECTAYSYQGHNGHDSVIEGFREQAIGVPVFAALDGTVTQVRDSEPDEQTTNASRPANLVTLLHQDGYLTQYLHLKRGSVSVTQGQVVRAGTQLGLTGSSGNSSWPHLHFTSDRNRTAFEPNAGACRPGASFWTSQPAFRRDVYARSFTFGTAAFSGTAFYPHDNVIRRGAYVAGTSTIYFRVVLHNRPALATYRIRVTRPDGSTASDTSGAYETALLRTVQSSFSRAVTLTETGTWTLRMYINGQLVVTAPFAVASTAMANRPPFAVRSAMLSPLEPGPTDVPMCRVTPGTLYRRDPDYDLVRYRYRWFVRGTLARDVVSAALADAIPSGLINAASELRCEVTPSDGVLTAPVAVSGVNSHQIPAGGSITSPNGIYRLTYQADGNVVIADLRTSAVRWSTGTSGTTGQLLMQ
ncbi:MAG: M23 family metallopeptidase, partial [Vicinamibacterales bacterium]